MNITDSTAAIEMALIYFLTRKGISEHLSNVYGLGTDGPPVMVGRHNGVGVKLQRRNQHLIQVHCVAHQLNLAASQAAKDIAYCKKYHDIIHSLYEYFSDSVVRYDKLRELQQLLHGKVKQIPDGTSVCWLSVEAAVKMIFQSYDAKVLALGEDKDGGKA